MGGNYWKNIQIFTCKFYVWVHYLIKSQARGSARNADNIKAIACRERAKVPTCNGRRKPQQLRAKYIVATVSRFATFVSHLEND